MSEYKENLEEYKKIVTQQFEKNLDKAFSEVDENTKFGQQSFVDLCEMSRKCVDESILKGLQNIIENNESPKSTLKKKE